MVWEEEGTVRERLREKERGRKRDQPFAAVSVLPQSVISGVSFLL